jgi:hypothetical protein
LAVNEKCACIKGHRDKIKDEAKEDFIHDGMHATLFQMYRTFVSKKDLAGKCLWAYPRFFIYYKPLSPGFLPNSAEGLFGHPLSYLHRG